MPNNRESESIFDAKPNQDIRHDIDTVHEKWSVETKRRLKHTLAMVMPIVTGIVLVYFLLALNFPQVPGYGLLNTLPGQEHAHEHGKQKKDRPENTIPLKDGELGYPKAKMKIVTVREQTPKSILNLLVEAVDSKPSEIHLTMLQEKDLEPEKLKKIKQAMACGLTINGKDTLEFTSRGKKHTVNLAGPKDVAFTPNDLAQAINAEYKRIYTENTIPVFVPFKKDGKRMTVDEFKQDEKRQAEEDKRQKAIEPVKQTFDILRTYKPQTIE